VPEGLEARTGAGIENAGGQEIYENDQPFSVHLDRAFEQGFIDSGWRPNDAGVAKRYGNAPKGIGRENKPEIEFDGNSEIGRRRHSGVGTVSSLKGTSRLHTVSPSMLTMPRLADEPSTLGCVNK
jgi:hypothetical protein